MEKFSVKAVQKLLDNVKAKYKEVGVEAGIIKDGVRADYAPWERPGQTIEGIATYAHYNEYGEGVPPRPFMHNAVEARGEAWAKRVGAFLLRGASVEHAFERAGELMRDDIRKSIEGAFGGYQPNSPETIEAKTRVSVKNGQAVGKHTPQPLIWTGDMHKTIGYKLNLTPTKNEE